ncbi:hypothetical protein B0T14DRAFT_528485 [Immersiella caudata]|uniref:Uncharacterized protein n=1 Tax=Immersiella caudata TaxID=314043 RepID=A0AA39WFG4_9PEZI|nr:hypothetical protein B0T14DRAFT_528485 [Immersiella caudata]
MTKSISLYRRLGLLAAGFISYTQGASAANPFVQQQYLIGDEGLQGYSNDDFRRAINVPIQERPRILPSINVTDPSHPNSPMNGWRLGVKFAENARFPEGNPNSGSKVFGAATLFLEPSRRELAEALDDYFLCSAVWTNGLSEMALAGAKGERGGTDFDSCDGMLSRECINEMVEGFRSSGFCQNQTMPRACAPFLANGTDGVTRGSNLPQTIGEIVANSERSTFYSAVTGPLDRNDDAAFETVRTWVFPVVLSWTPRVISAAPSFLGTPGDDTETRVACVSFAAAGSDSDKQSGDGIGSGSSRASGGVLLWLLVGALAACWNL